MTSDIQSHFPYNWKLGDRNASCERLGTTATLQGPEFGRLNSTQSGRLKQLGQNQIDESARCLDRDRSVALRSRHEAGRDRAGESVYLRS